MKYVNGVPTIITKDEKKLLNNHQTLRYTEIEIVYQNVRGLKTKANTFYLNASSYECDIIAITETWLSDDINSCEYFDCTFNVFRSNKHGKCRGVLMAVKTQYLPKEINLELPDSLQALDIVALNVEIGLLYEALLETLEQCLDVTQRILFLGDFNIPDLCSRLQNKTSLATRTTHLLLRKK